MAMNPVRTMLLQLGKLKVQILPKGSRCTQKTATVLSKRMLQFSSGHVIADPCVHLQCYMHACIVFEIHFRLGSMGSDFGIDLLLAFDNT